MYLTFLRAKNFESKVLSFLLKKAVCIKSYQTLEFIIIMCVSL